MLYASKIDAMDETRKSIGVESAEQGKSIYIPEAKVEVGKHL
jgi:hypothetical protein